MTKIEDKDYSEEDNFMFLQLERDILEQLNLPSQPIPVRLSVLTACTAKQNFPFHVLADECAIYCQQHPRKLKEFARLLKQLCYLAGSQAEKDGDNVMAQRYLTFAQEIH